MKTFQSTRLIVGRIFRINSPPKRPDKTQSQHEIRRGRGAERRDENFAEPAKRTRSLTREEAVRGAPGDGFEGGPPTRSASAHRLPGGPVPPARPSRADSRVTFADTVYLHVEKPLEDSSTPTRPKTKRDKNPNLGEDAESSSAKKDKVQVQISPLRSTVFLSFDFFLRVSLYPPEQSAGFH